MSYIFGPAPSRRLGKSLGVDIIPAKICSLDCLYCEVGATNVCTMERRAYTNYKDVISEFKEKFQEYKDNIDVVTITGAGEPTLHIDLEKILHGIKEIAEDTPMTILTNSTLLTVPEVYKTLLQFDIVVPSLDAVSIELFDKVNRPSADIDYDEVIDALIKFSHDFQGKLYLEILLLAGINDSHDEMLKFVNVISKMKVTKVQIGSASRPPAYPQAKVASDETLLKFANFFKSNGINAEVTGGFKAIHRVTDNVDGIEEKIVALLKMRPCTFTDIALVFNIADEKASEITERLFQNNKISSKVYNNDIYYTA